MSDSRISFNVTIMSEDTEEEQQFNADYGYPLRHSVVINATYDSGSAWPKLLERACEAISAYYGYDVKDKVFVEQFGKIINIFGHEDPSHFSTDSDADENPAT
jgi:hypothetical protein